MARNPRPCPRPLIGGRAQCLCLPAGATSQLFKRIQMILWRNLCPFMISDSGAPDELGYVLCALGGPGGRSCKRVHAWGLYSRSLQQSTMWVYKSHDRAGRPFLIRCTHFPYAILIMRPRMRSHLIRRYCSRLGNRQGFPTYPLQSVLIGSGWLGYWKPGGCANRFH